jgi:glycosyltransferase involved in cell wall biosynthesis
MVNNPQHEEPLVSVIVATLNSEKYLAGALKSITNQTYRNYEILVVDGGSSDGTRDLALSYANTKFISQQGKGLFDAWNLGVDLATGSFIGFLDSDDSWLPNTLSLHLDLLLSDTNLLGSIGHVKFYLNANEKPPSEFRMNLLSESKLAFMPGCFIGRKKIFEMIGYFETQWEVASDILWFAKVKALNQKIGLIKQIVLNKRVHGNNLSYTGTEKGTYSKELLELLHKRIREI